MMKNLTLISASLLAFGVAHTATISYLTASTSTARSSTFTCPAASTININTIIPNWHQTHGSVTATSAEGVHFANIDEVDDDFRQTLMHHYVALDQTTNRMTCGYRHGGRHTGRGEITAQLPAHVICTIPGGTTTAATRYYKECNTPQTCAVVCNSPASLTQQAKEKVKQMKPTEDQLKKLPHDLHEGLKGEKSRG